jgi:DNA-binding CsgD family transcriptional regulator
LLLVHDMTALIGVTQASRSIAPAGAIVRPFPTPTRLDVPQAAALAAVLGEIPSAAFVVWEDGRIASANRAGQAARDGAPAIVAARLLASLGGPGGSFRITRIPAPGSQSHFLAVAVESPMEPVARVAAAARSLALTPRQAQVLALLVLGRPNKAIAEELGCAESTVEIHVTALLGKSGCANRCEVVARLWSGSFVPPVQRGASWRL